MIEAHPGKIKIDKNNLMRTIDTLTSCADTCILCADACLAEDNVKQLVKCIRLNYDCADACSAAARMLLRQVGADMGLLHKQLEVCAAACRVCGQECEQHAAHHEHCRICAETCRACEKTCDRIIQEMTVAR
ncbi:MAG: four-helix bundle copper-binding protein [Candidatus Abyssobacteria bacterium SURF_5]|uniref:Four-helix bundle copper-binding protein n=1 Tax=Abyssobacteria bacterium (strain SURF_5) TaxID=2093360 RepID=A0A3A4NVN7_ABYX5|nr:MAG: four-helix bundle copper-binding protein [Candidatus Abyssubacteria bacterium SURF_5]